MKGLDFSMHLLFHLIATAKREGELFYLKTSKSMSYFEDEEEKEFEKKM